VSLCPNPELAEQLLRRWCPPGTAIRVEGGARAGRPVHLRVDIPCVPVAMPVSIQVSDLLGRTLDRNGAVRLAKWETVRQLVAELALRLHGDEAVLRVAPVVTAMRSTLRRRRPMP